MSKRMVTLKKAMILLSMGGATLVFGGMNCVTNANVSDFVSAVAGASFDSVAECLVPQVDGDLGQIVVEPTVDLLSDAFGNYVTRQIPNDPGVNDIWKQ